MKRFISRLFFRGVENTPARISFYVFVFIVSIPLIYLFGIEQMRFFTVPSRSMAPGIVPGDYLMTMKAPLYYRGDVVVFDDPLEPGAYAVKRIVGVSGDRVAVRGGALFINGVYASEPYRMEPIDYLMDEYTVSMDEVFVFGDNSNWSIDSHNWDMDTAASDEERKGKASGVPLDSIVGKVHAIYLPLKRSGKVKSYPLTNVLGE